MTTDNGTVTFHVNYNNVMLSKVFTIVKNKQGSQGVPGTVRRKRRNAVYLDKVRRYAYERNV